jgi:hypothetical protein
MLVLPKKLKVLVVVRLLDSVERRKSSSLEIVMEYCQGGTAGAYVNLACPRAFCLLTCLFQALTLNAMLSQSFVTYLLYWKGGRGQLIGD